MKASSGQSPSLRRLVGRKIVKIRLNPFRDGRGSNSVAHSPTILLDDGTILRFYVQETDVGECGIGIVPVQPNRG